MGEPRRRLRLAQIRTALLLGHGVADDDGRLVGDLFAAEFVFGAFDLLGPDCERGLGFETGIGRVGQAGRTTRSLLDLVPDVGQDRASVMTILLVGAPGEVRDLMLPRQRHQLVPARMEFDPVDAVAETVMRFKFGQMTVGQAGELLHVLVTGDSAKRFAAVSGPRRFAIDGRPKHRIARKGVETSGGLRLI